MNAERRRILDDKRAKHAPLAAAEKVAHDAALARLLEVATVTPQPATDLTPHQAVLARIDARQLRQKYAGKPVFPPEWDELRPRCKCCVWPDVDGTP